MTTEDLHGNERRSAPPALPPLVCMVIPDHSSFSVLRETLMTFACDHFKKLKLYLESIYSRDSRLPLWFQPSIPHPVKPQKPI
jgi:hypothetical protein